MKQLPNNLHLALSKSEARAICHAYEHLKGQPYIETGENKGVIECVAVAPFDDINKWVFLQHYIDCKMRARLWIIIKRLTMM